jgi:peptidoglycan/LPS O-acetylase OafA/YrhL
MQEATGKKVAYRPEIDGLRAVAVAGVIANHFNRELLPGGYLGVDLFFVISGFVISLSLHANRRSGIGDFLIGFYARRLRRLVPALAVFLVVTSLLVSLVDPQPESSLEIGRSALFGFSNILFYRSSTDYFSSSTDYNAFTHTWSLGVEEQFYFFYPLLYWFCTASGSPCRRDCGVGYFF